MCSVVLLETTTNREFASITGCHLAAFFVLPTAQPDNREVELWRCTQTIQTYLGCMHPGKTAHSLLEIFPHTDYVPLRRSLCVRPDSLNTKSSPFWSPSKPDVPDRNPGFFTCSEHWMKHGKLPSAGWWNITTSGLMNPWITWCRKSTGWWLKTRNAQKVHGTKTGMLMTCPQY